jgi:D-glycero-alpha-D-manno-heptose 1-phosphate guanylyltransferase
MSVELHQMTAVILAGGLGTRVRHLLPDLPKPMAPVAGKPFLEWVVRYLAAEGVRRMILSTGFLSEVVERHFQRVAIKGVTVGCVAEPEPLGTAGALLHATSRIAQKPETWLVLNGDSLVLTALTEVVAPLRDDAVAGVVVAVRTADAGRYGALRLGPAADIEGFEEKGQGGEMVNAGVYVLRDRLLQQFPRRVPLSFERDVFPLLIDRGARLRAHVTGAPFLDIGTPETLNQVQPFIQGHIRRFSLA